MINSNLLLKNGGLNFSDGIAIQQICQSWHCQSLALYMVIDVKLLP